MTEKIAKITGTFLGVEDHGILTATLTLDYGSSVQGAGGYCLDAPKHDADGQFVGRFGTAYGMEFVKRLIEACGVDSWEKVKGRTVLAVIDDGKGWHAPVEGIKPLPTERGTPFMFESIEDMATA